MYIDIAVEFGQGKFHGRSFPFRIDAETGLAVVDSRNLITESFEHVTNFSGMYMQVKTGLGGSVYFGPQSLAVDFQIRFGKCNIIDRKSMFHRTGDQFHFTKIYLIIGQVGDMGLDGGNEFRIEPFFIFALCFIKVKFVQPEIDGVIPIKFLRQDHFAGDVVPGEVQLPIRPRFIGGEGSILKILTQVLEAGRTEVKPDISYTGNRVFFTDCFNKVKPFC